MIFSCLSLSRECHTAHYKEKWKREEEEEEEEVSSGHVVFSFNCNLAEASKVTCDVCCFANSYFKLFFKHCHAKCKLCNCPLTMFYWDHQVVFTVCQKPAILLYLPHYCPYLGCVLLKSRPSLGLPGTILQWEAGPSQHLSSSFAILSVKFDHLMSHSIHLQSISAMYSQSHTIYLSSQGEASPHFWNLELYWELSILLESQLSILQTSPTP